MDLLSKIKKAVANSILWWSDVNKDLGFEMVDDEMALARYNLCQKCPRYDAANDTCLECGCIMAVKTKLKTDPIETVAKLKKIETKCPLEKW